MVDFDQANINWVIDILYTNQSISLSWPILKGQDEKYDILQYELV